MQGQQFSCVLCSYMEQKDCNLSAIPEVPGVYIFQNTKNVPLYVGRATNLRSRVRSYFSNRLSIDRGQRLAEAVKQAKHIEMIETDSVLEAYILEANLIKEYQPPFNVVDKDNKSFQFVGITKEDFPRVLVIRGRELEQETVKIPFLDIFGPFPKGVILKEALRILRKILPFRDKCTPYNPQNKKQPKKCFQAQIGLCPGICDGTMGKEAYKKRIREIRMFLKGRKKQLIKMLEKDMKQYAQKQEFEEAKGVQKRIFALQHIQDVSLLKRDGTETENSSTSFRIEAYDIAHTAGMQTVGAMVVLINGEKIPSEYRTFTIRNATKGDDIGALREVLSRRLGHQEWKMPNLIVVDGGTAHINAAEAVLKGNEVKIPVVSVVKTEKHTPREVLGQKKYTQQHEKEIITANAEAHRFAIKQHKKKRSREMFA